MHIADKIIEEAWEIVKECSYHRIGLRPSSFTSEEWTCKNCKYWRKCMEDDNSGHCVHRTCDIIMSLDCLKGCSYFISKNEDTDYVQ